MTSLPAGIARVPNMLVSDMMLRNATRTNQQLLGIQEQLATGHRINRPSDDAVAASTVSLLNQRLERSDQLERNLDHGQSALDAADQALGEANDLLLEARQIAQAQAQSTSTASERESQAEVVDSLLRGMVEVANRESVAGHIFGGQSPGRRPVEQVGGGLRYNAGDDGLVTDLGVGLPLPVTLGGSTPLGSTSARIEGQVDLNPGLTLGTRLADLDGARGVGVESGQIEYSYQEGQRRTIDLSDATTVGDVVDRIEADLAALEGESGETILGPDGVSIEGESIMVDMAGAPAGGPAPSLRFFDVGESTTAADLGLTDDAESMEFAAGSQMGISLEPRVTPTTPIAALEGIDPSEPLGEIRVKGLGREEVVDLSGAETVQDLRTRIEGTGLGLRVRIKEPGSRLMVLSEAASGRGGGVSIEEVPGNGETASRLGIRTLDAQTRLSVFNEGRGVDVIAEGVDPQTGEPDEDRAVDFTITLGNDFGIDVNLQPEDMATVGSMLGSINAQANQQLTAAGMDEGLFEAGLTDGPNGIALEQDVDDPSITGAISVEAQNGSTAAAQLGLLDGSYEEASGTLVGEDRARVRPDNVFTHLMDLRDALRDDDTNGITLAGEGIGEQLDLLAESRAMVGSRGRRLETEARHVEDRRVVDESTRSRLRDADFAEATSRLARLQAQLQGGYRAASSTGSLSLLDFLQ